MRARVLVADPGWSFRDKLPGPKRGAAKHYRCMSLAEICTFPLPPLSSDCWLFLWRVASMQLEALAVARAWGFETMAEVVWRKVSNAGQLRIGMGRSVRNAHETCLIGRRGRPPRASASIPSVFDAPRTEHSRKPDRFYEIVEEFSAGPYVELFARRERPGWTCLGDEVPCP